MAKQIIIGDVHGCLNELRDLTNLLKLSSDDQLIFCGDLINKGPDSRGVIEFVQWLGANICPVSSVLGNHEEKLLRWVDHSRRYDSEGISNPMLDRANRLQLSASQLTDNHIEFVSQFPLVVRLPAPANAVVVHGGIEPLLCDLPGADLTRKDFVGRHWRKVASLIRLRFLNSDNRFVALEDATDGDKFWADVYDGRFGKTIFGHYSWMQNRIKTFAHAIGIDLGCVYGGHLAAVVFESDRVGYRQVIVKGKNSYCSHQPVS